MQTIVHIKEGLWSNLATLVFCLALAAGAVWGDHYSHGEVSIFVWIFASILVLFCWVPINAIRRPKSRMLAIEGPHLVWRIDNQKAGEVLLEHRIMLSSIRALKWVFPKWNRMSGAEPPDPRLIVLTAEHGSHTLPDEFFPAVYRRRIEVALEQKIPGLKIEEKHESPD